MNCNAAQVEPSGILVIAMGNPLRRDDGAGMVAARLLRRRMRGAQRVRFITCRQLTPELAEPIGQVAHVAFLDASIALSPGHISWLPVRAAWRATDALGHQPRIESLLAMARMLYAHEPDAMVGAIGAMDLGFGRGLSPPVQRAAALLAVRVQGAIEGWQLRMDMRGSDPIPETRTPNAKEAAVA